MASIFDNRIMSSSDLKMIEELENAWRNTDNKNLKEQLHNQAESIRRSYGYSGGADGSEYNVLDAGTSAAALASNAYVNALEAAENNRQQTYSDQQAAAEELGKARLREAYIKNMQNTLGLEQNMKANGISGGLSESTRAAYDNNYMNQRDAIYGDTLDAKQEIAREAAQSAYDSGAQIAQQQYNSAVDRADRLTASEQTQYDREQDALNRAFQNQQFEYQQQKDASDLDYKNRLFEYQQQKDALDREYEEKKDALDREYDMMSSAYSAQTAAQKLNASQNQQQISNIISLMKSGYYSPEFADILGLDSEQIQFNNGQNDMSDLAWKMLSKGIYDDSFPEVLGYSADVLKQYAEYVRAGF